MKLYTYDAAPNPRRLNYFLKYKGIEIETEQIDLGPAQQQHSDEYVAINPMRTVPALITDDGDLLTEVIAQCVYLEELHPEKPLLGSTALEKAMVFNWDHRLFMTGVTAVADIFRNSHPAFKGNGLPGPLAVEQIPELVERGKLRLEQFWSMMDEHLATSNWIAGENFSFADIDMVCTVEFAGWIKAGIPEGCANLQAWYERAVAELG